MANYTMSDRVNFIRGIIGDVTRVSNETGISLEFMLAQVALETGWGTKVLSGTNNLFNIKADSSWTGPTATFTVREYINGKWVDVESKFRVYSSYEESINNWLDFLQSNPRYNKVFDPDVKGDLNKIAQAMEDAGYATDPMYAEKIIATAKGPTMRRALFYYDNACWTNPYNPWVDNIFNNMSKLFSTASVTTSPIALDLNGDGIATTNVKDGAYFDHDGNGFAEQTGWVNSDDGLLVMDRNGDGVINDGKELFGNQTILNNGTKASNGFQALSELDENKDGKIDANDSAFSQLKIWQDIDGDGYSSADELFTLDELGIQSINTGYTDTNITDANGNTIKQTGSFTKSDGSTGDASDVWFKTDNMYTIANEWVDVPEDIAELPDLQGYGNVYDLQQAMVRDTSGELKSLVEQFMNETDAETRRALIIPILYKWTGVENIDPLSRAATRIYGNVIKNHARSPLSFRTGDRNKRQVIGYRRRSTTRRAIGENMLKLAD